MLNYSFVKFNSTQKGVGLIEVLVAILLLAVAVLGFSVLQMQAVRATDESLIRTQATSVVRGLSESMRANTHALDTYQSVVNDTSSAIALPTGKCNSMIDSAKCTADQIATKEALAATSEAARNGVTLAVQDCPGTSSFSTIKCIIAAWDDTNAAMGSDSNDCADALGVYKTNSSCLIVEAY